MLGQKLTIDRQLGARIRFARVERSLSRAAFGALLGITFEEVMRFENGEVHISSEQLTDIAAALGKSVSFFFRNWVSRSSPTTVFAEAGACTMGERLATWACESAGDLPAGTALRASPFDLDPDWETTDRRVGYLQ